MDTLGLSTQLKVRQCSQCQGDTEFYCDTCKRDLCLQCKEKHVLDLYTKHHDVIYREKFKDLPKQEPALLYDTRKQQVGNEQLKLMSTPVLHTSVCVTGVSRVRHISRVMSDRVWVSDRNNLILTDTTGDTIHRVTDITTWYGGHTVNSSGELIYIDSDDNITKLSTDNKTVTRLLQCTSPWYPDCVYCSPSTGDLIIGMCNYATDTGKVTRYNSSGQHILTIEHDNRRHTLYSWPLYITENNNGDIIVSDRGHNAVVVTERGGRHRFSYTGPLSGSSLLPRGICTDALSHILVCDYNTHTVQMIDKDGHFLSLLLTRHGINTPYSLNYDDKTHLLWVGSLDTNTVSVYRYLQRRYSLTDDSVDDEKRIFKSTDDTNIWGNTSEKTELKLMLSRTGREEKEKIPVPDDLSLLNKPGNIGHPLSHYSLESGVKPIHPSSADTIDSPPKVYPSAFSTQSVMSSSQQKESVDTLESEEEYNIGTCSDDSEEEDEFVAGTTMKYVSIMAETLMTKRRVQVKENREADIRKSLPVNSLDNETKSRKLRRSQIINKVYGD